MATITQVNIKSKKGSTIEVNSGTAFLAVTAAVSDCFQSTAEDQVSFALKNIRYKPSVVGVKFQFPVGSMATRVLSTCIEKSRALVLR